MTDHPRNTSLYRPNTIIDDDSNSGASGLHPETPVLTRQGFMQACIIKAGDEVLDRNGRWTRVTETIRLPLTAGEMLHLRIAADNRDLVLASGHYVLAVRNDSKCSRRGGRCRRKSKMADPGRLQWIQAKDLAVSDLVVIPQMAAVPATVPNPEAKFVIDLAHLLRRASHGGVMYYDTRVHQRLIDAVHAPLGPVPAGRLHGVTADAVHLGRRRGFRRTFPSQLTVNDDLAMWLGLFMAEGWTSKQSVEFALHIDERDTYARFLADYAHRVWRAGCVVKTSETNRGIRLKICSILLHDLCAALTEGATARSKFVPPMVFGWSMTARRAFVKGLFRGDGCLRGREVSLGSASERLVTDTRLLLMGIGIKSSFRINVPGPGRREAHIRGRLIPPTVSYGLHISGSDFNVFAAFEEEAAAVSDMWPDRKGILTDTHLFVPIRRIRPLLCLPEDLCMITTESGSLLSTCIVQSTDSDAN